MKIAIATYYWQSSQGGGINKHLIGLVDALKKYSKDNEIEIIFIDGEDKNYYKVKTGRFSIIRESYSALKKIKPDVINVRESRPLLLGAALYCLFHKNVRLFYSFHTEPTPIKSKSGKIKKLFLNIPLQWALNKCNSVIFISNRMERPITQNSGIKITTKKAVIHPGINPTSVTSNEIDEFYKKFSIKRDSIVLLIQGFTAYGLKAEGVKLVIRALKEIITKFPKVVLLITREGDYTNELRDYAKKFDVFDNIIFTGDLEKPDVPLKICDIFVWPWLGEMGIGMSLLEAMSKGKPIIATSVYGTQELIKNEKTGLVVQATEMDLIKGITRLISDNDLKSKLGRNAKEMAFNDLTWEKSAKKHIMLYEGKD